jgi:hypothetical protein
MTFLNVGITQKIWNFSKAGVTTSSLAEYLTNSMEQSSIQANRFSASQENPRILLNPKVHYRITTARHLSLSWAGSIQSMNPSPHFLKIHFDITLPRTLGHQNGLDPSGFPTKILYRTLLSRICATCPAQIVALNLITRIIFGEYRS